MAGTYRPALPARGSSRASRESRRSRRMLRRGAVVSGLAAAAVVVAACGSPGGNTSSGGGNAGSTGSGGNAGAAAGTVSTRDLTGIGTALVTSSGMTIYTPKTPAESEGNIKCTGSCLSFWFPVTGNPADLGSSGLPGTIGTIHRPDDGKTQLTYNGKPLYTFRLDLAPGQAHGNNFTDHFGGISFTWHAVTTNGSLAGTGQQGNGGGYANQGGSPGY